MSWSHDEIQALLAVADEGSILGAATQLETSRARIRRNLASLEGRAGTSLVFRDDSGLHLTAAGAELVEHGRRLTSEASLLLKQVAEIGRAPRGVVQLAFPIGPPDEFFARGFAELRKRLPDVHVSVRFVPDPLALLPHEAETAVSFSDRVPDSCVALRGRPIRIRLIASTNYLESHGQPQSVDELAAHEVLAWRPPEGYQGLALRDGGLLNLEPSCLHDDIALLRKMGEIGLGLVWVPILMPLEPDMRVVLRGEVVGTVNVQFVVPKIYRRIPRIQAFWDLVESMGAESIPS